MGIHVISGEAFARVHYYKPDDGMHILEFVGFEEATKKKTKDDGSEERVPSFRLSFKMYAFDTKLPIIDPETNEQAVYLDNQTQSLHPRSNLHARLSAVLGRNLEVGEDSDALFAEAMGKRCGGNFLGGWLKTTMRMPAGMLV